ncbi:MAG: hypothetical protein ACLUPL_04245 [Butyricimonas virosa]
MVKNPFLSYLRKVSGEAPIQAHLPGIAAKNRKAWWYCFICSQLAIAGDQVVMVLIERLFIPSRFSVSIIVRSSSKYSKCSQSCLVKIRSGY